MGSSSPLLLPGEGKELVPGLMVLKTSSDQTGGSFEVFELGGPGGPPPHIHRERRELFYVVAGTFEFTVGENVFEAGPGSVVLVPPDTRHGFKAGEGAKALVFVAPAGLEGFFSELGAGMAAGKSDADIRQALEARYDVHPG
jgi:quercetin dioxygenase-like cupin family protein